MNAAEVPPDQVARKAAADHAVINYITSGMIIGLGTGSTAAWAVNKLGELVQQGVVKNIKCVCTSRDTESKARSWNLHVVEVDELDGDSVDLAIDGADEIWQTADGHTHLIKGRGGALYREKFIESMCHRFICIADADKLVPHLGVGTLPIEIVGHWNVGVIKSRIRQACISLDAAVLDIAVRSKDHEPFVTDNGNWILDVTFDANGIQNPVALHSILKAINGVVETGLFVNMSPITILGNSKGEAWLASHPPK